MRSLWDRDVAQAPSPRIAGVPEPFGKQRIPSPFLEVL